MDILLLLSITLFMSMTSAEDVVSCNKTQAENCAIQFQKRYDDVYMEYDSQDSHENTPLMSDLCRSILKGNDLTECYEENIKMCNEDTSKYVQVQWRKTMADSTHFCNVSACNNFQQLSTCAGKIYETGITDGQVKRFCTTFNESIDCANYILQDHCLFDKKFYYSLIAKTTLGYYGRACLTGCATIDQTIAAINGCWSITRDRSITDDCQKHNKFKNCMYSKGDICPEVGKLVPKYFRYDTNEIFCTTTTSTTTTTTTTPMTTTTTEMTSPTTEAEEITTVAKTTTTEIPTTETTTDSPTETSDPNSPEIMSANEYIVTTIMETSSHSTQITMSKMQHSIPPNDQSEELSIFENEQSLKDLIEGCLNTYDVNNTTFQIGDLDFNKCMVQVSVMNCLYQGLNSTENAVILYRLLPHHSRNITDNILFSQCTDIINSYNNYILNVESSCGRPRVKNPGCTGHNYGLLGCSGNNVGVRLQSVTVTYVVIWLTVKALLS